MRMSVSFSTLLRLACLATTCLAPALALASTYSCSETGLPSGATPRTLSLELDASTDAVSMNTSDGPAQGVLQTTLDLYVGRLETEQGKVFLLSLHRYTGRLTVMVEAPVEQEERRPEFIGTCAAQ